MISGKSILILFVSISMSSVADDVWKNRMSRMNAIPSTPAGGFEKSRGMEDKRVQSKNKFGVEQKSEVADRLFFLRVGFIFTRWKSSGG